MVKKQSTAVGFRSVAKSDSDKNSVFTKTGVTAETHARPEGP